MVGVNKYVSQEKEPMHILKIDDRVEKEQKERLREIKSRRDDRIADNHLRAVAKAARDGENLMPYIIEAVKAYATVGEISDVFREVYGIYRDPGIF